MGECSMNTKQAAPSVESSMPSYTDPLEILGGSAEVAVPGTDSRSVVREARQRAGAR
jgi:hypothetical protein